MLVTGITQNVTESIDAVTLLNGEVVGPTSNIPRLPMAQSHFPSQQQVEQDGYDSDSSVDHNAAIHSEGLWKLMNQTSMKLAILFCQPMKINQPTTVATSSISMKNH